VACQDDLSGLAVPGGIVMISEKLLDTLETEDQVAFVIAHEIAHQLARHGGESMSR
jgi:predicted Zn-dependent protease